MWCFILIDIWTPLCIGVGGCHWPWWCRQLVKLMMEQLWSLIKRTLSWESNSSICGGNLWIETIELFIIFLLLFTRTLDMHICVGYKVRPCQLTNIWVWDKIRRPWIYYNGKSVSEIPSYFQDIWYVEEIVGKMVTPYF